MGEPHSSPNPCTRRSVLRFLAGTGFIGGAWGAGFTALNAFRPPSATICGKDEWQLTLVESGRSRALVLMGVPDDTIEETLTRMMGSFRQRIDLVIGTAATLHPLGAKYRSWWNVQLTIILEGDGTPSTSPATATIVSPTLLSLGPQIAISLTPVSSGRWKMSEHSMNQQSWIASVAANGSTIQLAERLDDFMRLPLGPSAVMTAPGGDLRAVWSIQPECAIAMNSDHVPTDLVTAPDNGAQDRRWLVPVFPDDFTQLAFLDHGIGLPDWARSVQYIESSGA